MKTFPPYSALEFQILLQESTALHLGDPKEFSIKAEMCATWASENVMEKSVMSGLWFLYI